MGGWHTQLVSSKVRVTSQVGMTVPRSELGGLVLAVRLIDTVIIALEVRPKRRVSIIGDSTCTISSCETNCSSLAPYFQNRVAEIVEKMSSWGNEASVDMTQEMLEEIADDDTVVDKLNWIAGPLNLPTRGTVNWQEIGKGTLWQTGPEFIGDVRETRPVNRNFIEKR